MQRNRKEPVILTENETIELCGYKVILRDRRDGRLVDGYAIKRKIKPQTRDDIRGIIKKSYLELGYEIEELKLDEVRKLELETVKEFILAKNCKNCKRYQEADDGEGGIISGCIETADMELEESEPELRKQIIEAEQAGGFGCPYYINLCNGDSEQERKPDFLRDCMKNLEEIMKERAQD